MLAIGFNVNNVVFKDRGDVYFDHDAFAEPDEQSRLAPASVSHDDSLRLISGVRDIGLDVN